jgi:hypothetical protein
LGDAPERIALAESTHELLVRWLSALPLRERPRLVTTDGEFHTIRRQLDRLAEEGIEVVRVPAADADTLAEIQRHLSDSGSAQGVIVYSFGRTRDIEAAAGKGIVALRAPIGVDELRDAMARSALPGNRMIQGSQQAGETPTTWEFSGSVAARRFSPQQLANLAAAQSDVDCECPKHLAQLVSDLSAFEIYSDRCSNRDDEDAALHRYLHRITAEARALVETALQKVAEAEGLRY